MKDSSLAPWGVVAVAALAASCASEPTPPPRRASAEDVQRLAEPVPDALVEASKASFSAGRPFFIWRDGEGTVSAPPGSNQYITVHYAVAPGQNPGPFTAVFRVDSASGQANINTVSWSGQAAPRVLVSNSGPTRLGGRGTAAIYFLPIGMISPHAQPISNVIAVPVTFSP